MAPTTTTSRLMVLMFTDLVGSVELKGRLGAAAYTDLIARHDHLFRHAVDSCEGAKVIQDTGDGFLARFNTGSDAVSTALRFQHALQTQDWGGNPLKVRIGLNLGQVTEISETGGGGNIKYVGLATDIASRIMSLAQGGQTLMTRSIFDDARQYVREHPRMSEDGPLPVLRWMAHGPYLFKGSEEPTEVFEVGAEGHAPLSSPPDSEKARRAVGIEDEETLGWRPAAGLEVPRRRGWVIQQKLGEGGFGEVWLGKNNRTKDQRVFKFCFDAERLRSFKRELTLFKLLREALGDRKDIARLYEVQLEEPPYFLESEFSGYGSLTEWAEQQGGIAKVPLDLRIDMVARTAEAVAAAHSIGVLHKDLKPSNILIFMSEDGVARPRLADFGIGMVTDRGQLEKRDITMTGMTEGLLDENASSRTGTRMYAPPESLTGAAFTVQGDIYALGVFLYQMAAGDLGKPLSTGWEADVPDPLLQADIAACVMGDRDKRLSSAKELADRLRALPERRREAKRRKFRRRALAATSVATGLGLVAAVWGVREFSLRTRAVKAEKEAVEQRDKAVALKDKQLEVATGYIFDMDKEMEQLEGATAARKMVLKAGSGLLSRLGELDPDDLDLQFQVGQGYLKLADIQAGLRSGNVGAVEDGLKSCADAIAVFERLTEARPKHALSRYYLGLAHLRLGDLHRNQGENQKALDEFTRSLADAEASATLDWDKGEAKSAGRLAASAELKVSDVHRTMGNPGLAREFFDRSLKRRLDAIAGDPNDLISMRDLAVAYTRDGKLLERAGDLKGAVARQRESLEIREKILEKSPNDSARAKRDVAIGNMELSSVLSAGKEYESALQHGAKASETIAFLIEQDPKDDRLKDTAADINMNYGSVLRSAGKFEQAVEALQRNIDDITARLAVNPKNQSLRYIIAQCQHKAGEALFLLGKKTESRAMFTQEIESLEILLKNDPNHAQGKVWLESARKEIANIDNPKSEEKATATEAKSP